VSRTAPRTLAASVLVAGVALGTLSDRLPRRLPLRAGDYWILAGDFHVHAFPGDGGLAPWTLRDEAAHAGLDVIAVTNHNQVLAARLARWVTERSDGPIVLIGQEITNPAYHMIAIGIERTVNADQPAAGAIDDVHAQGGVAVAAHPSRGFRGYEDDVAVARLDGAERAHPSMHSDETERKDYAAFFDRARLLNPRISPIGSSDFHATSMLARCRTFVFARERTSAGVLDAIRNRRTVAADGDGRLYGDPALVGLVQDAAPAGRSDEHPVWRRVSVALAWLGVLGVLLCRRRRSG
jgi:hypothetical protein